jgi:uridylate kinase
MIDTAALLHVLLVLQLIVTVTVNTVLANDDSKTSGARHLTNNTLTRLLQSSVLVKIGGSSITDKATREALNESALDWFARSLTSSSHGMNLTFVIVHGAGSFGHHTAKEYGLGSNNHGLAMSGHVGQVRIQHVLHHYERLSEFPSRNCFKQYYVCTRIVLT